MNRCIAPKNMTNQIFILRTDVLHQKYDEPNDVCMLWTDLMHQKMRWTNYVYYEQMFCNKKILWIKILWTDVLHLKLQSCTFFSKFANFATIAQSAQVCLFCTILSTFAQVFKFAQSAQLSIFALFSCPEQLNRTHCPSVPLTKLTIRVFTTLQSDPRDLWPLRHLIREMRRHDLTKIYLPTYIPT